MCIRRETQEKAPPFLTLIHILPICFVSAQVLYMNNTDVRQLPSSIVHKNPYQT